MRILKKVLRTPLPAITLTIALATAMSGCAVGPDYTRPSVEVPATWRIDYPQAAELTNLSWWQQFQDPVLDNLMETALRENYDIRIAAARVEQYLGQLSTTRAQFFPQIGYGLDVSRNRSSAVGVSPLPAGADPWYQLYQGTISAAWQIDLFGRVRRQSEAAQARVYASEQGRRGTLLTVISGVASSYITLRSLDRKLEISRATAANYADSLRIFKLRFAGGVISQVEVSQVESQYQQAMQAIPLIEQQIAAQENLLSVLLGRAPGPILRGRGIEELAVPSIPPGLPASLIERRPDVLQAEQNLPDRHVRFVERRRQQFHDRTGEHCRDRRSCRRAGLHLRQHRGTGTLGRSRRTRSAGELPAGDPQCAA
jgi:multidrug efflux system outer membrane protein